MDENGNVYLVEASGDEYGLEDDEMAEYEGGEDDGHQIIDGDMDDEEFLRMMEREAAEGRLRMGAHGMEQ